MCTKVTCPKCKRPTWRGCGAHVEQVLGDIPKDKRCQCKAEEKSDRANRHWWGRS